MIEQYPMIHVELEGDGAWSDLPEPHKIVHYQKSWRVALLKQGMRSGRSSIALRLDLPNGDVVVAQTSLAAWLAATKVLEAGDQVGEPG